MEVLIRDFVREDVSLVGSLWLEALQETDLDGQRLYPDAERRLRAWLIDRVRERSALGRVAEVEGTFTGFVLGRVGEWDASPPILHPRRIGLIDVVCVTASHRRRGIGSRLVSDALSKMKLRGAERVETTYQIGDVGATRMWVRMGFNPSFERAWTDFAR